MTSRLRSAVMRRSATQTRLTAALPKAHRAFPDEEREFMFMKAVEVGVFGLSGVGSPGQDFVSAKSRSWSFSRSAVTGYLEGRETLLKKWGQETAKSYTPSRSS